ncbi:MAG: SGNH/GDSL hydrolase family protein [Armatimonadota bacterium]
MSLISDAKLVLFQGDSITDAGRSRENDDDLGCGYAMLTAAWYSALYQDEGVRFANRGVSGNRTVDLLARWQEDCIDLSPDVVSIMIGVNDAWRAIDSGIVTTPAEFETNYRELLDRTKVITSRIVLLEPFLFNAREDYEALRADLDPKIAVVRKLAAEYGAILVPLDTITREAAERREPSFWALDGVHPTPAGHALITQAWLRAVGG